MNLTTELANDPIARGYASMTDKQAADSFNVLDRPTLRTLNAGDLNAWAAGAGRYRKIETAMEGSSPAGISDAARSMARAAWRMVDRDSTQFDPNSAEQEGLVDALVAAGVLSDDDKAALWGRAGELISRAEELRRAGATIPMPVRTGDITVARSAQ
jgi:hypothetical protein